jgi:uncharacterized protein
MSSGAARHVAISLDDGESVSGLWLAPEHAHAVYVFGHGAGAGMTHTFMESFATGLAERGIATLRYQFPYMERGSKRVDSPAVAQATVRAAVDAASSLAPGLPLLAGGKSFGGRMSSQAQAAAPLPGVRGLVFVGFPLHPAKKPATERGDHLTQVMCPMLFLQGTRDELAELPLVTALAARLGERATLVTFEEADHSFHVPARSGRTDAQVRDTMLDAVVEWSASCLAQSRI